MWQKFLPVSLLFFFLVSCKNEPEPKEIPLQFSTTSVVKKSGKGCHTSEFDCTIISLNIPVAQGPEKVAERINDSFQSHVFSLVTSEEPSPANNYEEFAKDFIANQQKTAVEFQEPTPWKAVIAGTVILKTQTLVSIAVDSEIFMGGAHGYSSISYLNFSPKTGAALTHTDLFKEGFSKLAEERFRKKFDIPLGAPINSTGLWFEGDKFTLPSNIGFDGEKVILLYNSYEISSYSDGEFRLEIPLRDVKPFLKFSVE